MVQSDEMRVHYIQYRRYSIMHNFVMHSWEDSGLSDGMTILSHALRLYPGMVPRRRITPELLGYSPWYNTGIKTRWRRRCNARRSMASYSFNGMFFNACSFTPLWRSIHMMVKSLMLLTRRLGLRLRGSFYRETSGRGQPDLRMEASRL